jgi:S1-C subfamily serine protease
VGTDGTEYRPPDSYPKKFCIHRSEPFNFGAGVCTVADEIAKGALKSQQGINTWETFGIMNPDGPNSFAWTITSLKENRQGSSKAAEAGKIPSTEKSKRPGSLGVAIQSVTPELAEALGLKEPRGALVAEVTKDGPAEKAGIERGDVITSFNGTNIKDSHDLPPLVMETPAGDNAEVLVLRDKRERRFTVKLGERSEPLK